MYEAELVALLEAAKQRNHRATVICHPERFHQIGWVFEPYAQGCYACFRSPQLDPPKGCRTVNFSSFEDLLGETVDYVIYEATRRYDPNSFAALADTVRGGGLFVLVTDVSEPPTNPKFEAALGILVPRFVGFVESSDLYAHIHKKGIGFCAKRGQTTLLAGPFRSRDQERAYRAALDWFGAGGEVLVFLSRRGRGKSALMGMLLRELCSSGALAGKVYVTSSSPTHLGPLLRHLGLGVRLRHWGDTFMVGQTEIVVCGPDSVPPSSTVFVDEASTLPFNTLLRIVEGSSRAVLSTTNYGYEGSGRSFQVKLLEEIRRRQRKLLVQELFEPVRYSVGDPLEEALTNTFLFFGCPQKEAPQQGHTVLETLGPAHLAKMSQEELQEVYCVLTEAHYRNEPGDLSLLLENTKTTTLVYRMGHTPLGVALCVEDGPISDTKADAILRGASFPGDLITERLTARSSSKLLAALRGQRIVRIAVKPAYQRRGHGSAMLGALERLFEAKYDWLGASFSADPETTNFWFKNGYMFVAISWSTGRYAKYPSTICVKPLSTQAKQVFDGLADRFRKHVLAQIHQRTLETGVYARIVKSLAKRGCPLSPTAALVNFAEWDLPAELVVPDIADGLFVLAEKLELPEIEAAIRLLRWEATRSDRLRLKAAMRRILRSGNKAS